MQLQPQGLFQLRFGWSAVGHREISDAAVALLPVSSARLKNFLAPTAMEQVHAKSAEEDSRRAGPNHFVNLENIIEANAAEKPWEKTDRRRRAAFSFEVMQNFFSPALRKARQEKLNTVTHKEFQGLDNVFRKSIAVYQDLVSIFQEIKTRPQQKAMLLGKLIEKLGETHYWDDLHQPMHTSAFYRWKLETGKLNAHRFLEGKLMNKQAYTEWRNQLMGRNNFAFSPVPLSLQEIRADFLQQIRDGYMILFDLVAADLNARQGGTEGRVYKALLRNAWLPLTTKRMDEAALNKAALLHSAYQAGGSPDLSLPTEENFSTSV